MNNIAIAKLQYLAHGGMTPEAGTAAAGEALAAQYLLDKTGTAEDVAALADWQWHHAHEERVAVALEQIAAALAAHDTTAPATLTPDSPADTFASFQVEFPLDTAWPCHAAGVIRWEDDGRREFVLDVADDITAATPDDLHALAQYMRHDLAAALDDLAAQWAAAAEHDDERTLTTWKELQDAISTANAHGIEVHFDTENARQDGTEE